MASASPRELCPCGTPPDTSVMSSNRWTCRRYEARTLRAVVIACWLTCLILAPPAIAQEKTITLPADHAYAKLRPGAAQRPGADAMPVLPLHGLHCDAAGGRREAVGRRRHQDDQGLRGSPQRGRRQGNHRVPGDDVRPSEVDVEASSAEARAARTPLVHDLVHVERSEARGWPLGDAGIDLGDLGVQGADAGADIGLTAHPPDGR